MSDHIGSFLNLKRRITEAGHKLDDILVVHAILHSLSCSNIWDIVKWNLLDKEKVLTLDLLSAELISVHDYAERNRQANKNEKKSKSNQMLLLAKSALSLNYSGRRGDLMIDWGGQETAQLALDAISAIKKAIGHQNALPTSQAAKATRGKLTNLVVLQI